MSLPTPPDAKLRGLRIASSYAVAAAIGAAGILMAHHPMILSGLERMQRDLGDTRFNNYIIEHCYRWLRGEPHHADFWSPPIFFPTWNTAAYSDLLLSVVPIYGAFRAYGLSPDTSFQFWMIAISGLNFLFAFHFLRRRLRLCPMAAGAGAFLFAFGAPRINQIGHQQLLPQFMSLITVDALFGLFTEHEPPTWKRGLLWLAVALGLVTQFYSGFYLGYFLLLSLGIAAGLAMLWPSTRRAFLATLRRDASLIVVTAVVSGLLMRPMVVHYLVASQTVGVRNFWGVRSAVPSWKSLFYLGPESWLWGWPFRLGFYPRGFEIEKRLGIGLVTMVACTAGLYWNRDRRSIRLIAVVSFILLLSVIPVPRIAALGISVAAGYLALAGLYHVRREHPWIRLLVPGLIFALLQVGLLGSRAGVGIGLFALLLVVSDLYQSGDEPWLRLVLVVLALGLGLSLFSPSVLAIGAGVGGLAAGAAAIFGLRPYGRVGLVALVGLLLFACIATYLKRPEALITAGSAPLVVALTKPSRLRLSVDTLFATLFFALLAAVAYRDTDTGWYVVYIYAPGASALRALGRTVLMSLIAWAIGLGLFVKEMQERRRPIGAMLITLVCLLEQGLTTPSYDKQEQRIAVDAIARRIDRRDSVLYYSSHRAPMPTPNLEMGITDREHLDAMWAGLERGVPTINGYSGNSPPSWDPLRESSIHNECDSLRLETSLRHWAGERGLSLECISWVGGPGGWPSLYYTSRNSFSFKRLQ